MFRKVYFYCVWLVLFLLLSGCASFTQFVGRGFEMSIRESDLTKARLAAEAGEAGACKSLVTLHKNNSDKNPRSFESRIDYEYIKQGCIKLLTLRATELAASENYDPLLKTTLELLDIDPGNGLGLELLAEYSDLKSPNISASDRLAALSPTSSAARIRNESDLNEMIHYKVNDQATNPTRKNVTRKLALDFEIPQDTALYVVLERLSKLSGVNIHLHPKFNQLGLQPSAEKITSKKYTTATEVLAALSREYQINFIFFDNEITGYLGSEVDLGGEPYLSMLKAEYVPIATATAMLKTAIGEGKVVGSDEVTKTIWLVATKSEFLRAMDMMSSIDVRPGEVLVDVEIYEVQSDILNNIGLRLPQVIKFGLGASGSVVLGGAPGVPNNSFKLDNILAQVRSQTVRMIISDPAIQAQFNSGNTFIRILSKPNLRVQDGQKSRIYVGNKIPVFTTTASSTGFVSESVNYVESGLKLEIKASIEPKRNVLLDVNLESTLLTSTVTSLNGTTAPQLGTRTAQVQMTLGNGETAILGGLISSNTSSVRNGLPLLGLTELSPLGGYNSSQSTAIELVVMVTPHIQKDRIFPSRALIANSPTGSRMALPGIPYMYNSQPYNPYGNQPYGSGFGQGMAPATTFNGQSYGQPQPNVSGGASRL